MFVYMYIWVYTKRIRKVATCIQMDTHLVQQSISEKVTGSCAFFHPAVYQHHWCRHEQVHFCLHAALAQVISTVRTAHAFGSQKVLGDL
ncbi:uncharacterized protein PHACADRAFT_202128 [Phanerochaete carnosa HHB-10118-sp]|uniref:Uncharacterized protein n=1 Tax=Phanerochaete carnosa (strain HHB-10118-sp) TaxID=650164 RepID=K5VD07_PHACS|nr:uncharacterized protein PHACADRAFT_202128 [Phanerochaete carnosa HHB-10118-sp]EKM49003.1 hypothetical protein PHACADRAFT_202128 [Phanerochaete carnosa HHB-10118-sp]